MTIAATPTVAAYPMHEGDDEGDISMSDLPSATHVSNANNSITNTVPTSTTGTTLPVPPVIVDGGIPMSEQPRIGAVCCGCCCDFRRAVIIVDSIIIGLSVYTLIDAIEGDETAASIQGYDETGTVTIDDDQLQEELDQVAQDGLLASAIVSGIVMVLAIVPVYGACHFNTKMIAFGIVVHVVSFITRFIVSYFLVERAEDLSDEIDHDQPWSLYTTSAIALALFIYPHVGLIMEINAGIMTPETYLREDYSCCCNNTRRRPTATPVQAYSNSNNNNVTMNGELPTVPAYR